MYDTDHARTCVYSCKSRILNTLVSYLLNSTIDACIFTFEPFKFCDVIGAKRKCHQRCCKGNPILHLCKQ